MRTLRVLAVGDPAVYGYTNKEFQIIENYEKSNNIKIVFDIVEWEVYYNTLLQSFLRYNYDIVMIAGHLWLTDFVSKGYLSEINVEKDEEYDYEDFVDTIRNELVLYNKQYLLPSFCDGHMLAYRKDKMSFKQAQSISILDTLSKINVGETCLKAHPSELFLDMLPYLRGFGVEPFGSDGKSLFDKNKMIHAMRHYKNMVKLSVDNTLSYGNKEVLEAIQSNQVNCAVSWGGQIGQILNEKCIEPNNLDFIGLEESWNVTWSFAFPKIGRNKKEALAFVKYLTSKKIDRIIGAYCGNPTRRSTFLIDQDKYPWYKNLFLMIKNAKPLPNVSNTGNIIGIFTEEFESYLNDSQNEEKTIQNIITRTSL
jgi:multiple sugar transport system substrate-binding protein